MSGICTIEAPITTTEINTINDGWKKAIVEFKDLENGYRSYILSSNVPLKKKNPDDRPAQKVDYDEIAGQSIIRTGNAIFDALFALAHHEVRQNSLEGIFKAGEDWPGAWTRDVAYSVQLALASVDPITAKNSLNFKLSELKTGGNLQIMQDTGTGGSYPVSTDRVVWAAAAYELLKYLDGQARNEFLNTAYTAITNTVEHDRKVVFDSAAGLYRGEETFLDWREQTYPVWTANEPLPIGISKALSTNILHFKILEVAAELAGEKGLTAQKEKYQNWAADLKKAINQKFYLKETGLYSAMILEDIQMRCYDLLGEALAVIFGIADENQATSVVANYPHTNLGAPVVFPQQQERYYHGIRYRDTPYHNQTLWPFATAYWVKAAAKFKNTEVVDRGIDFLMKNAAFNLSNMENAKFLYGENDQTKINSRRQLWSVAGYMGVVLDVIFGLDATQDGIKFIPFITNKTRNLFKEANRITLQCFSYKGKKIDVTIHLPEVVPDRKGYYKIAGSRFNGNEIGTDYVKDSNLREENIFEISLGDLMETNDPINLISDNGSNLHWAPQEPELYSVSPVNGQLELKFSSSGETGVTFNIYRDGTLRAPNVQGTSWPDPDSSDYNSNTYFYAVQAVKQVGDPSQNKYNYSFPSQTMYFAAPENLKIIGAKEFINVGGDPTDRHGQYHYQNWGGRNHTLEIPAFTPPKTGTYRISLYYGNGTGPINTGKTCAVKKVTIKEKNTGNMVAESVVEMPQLGDDDWDKWRDSSSLEVKLNESEAYQIKIYEDQDTLNMSFFKNYACGGDVPYNNVNIAQVKLLLVHQ
ncbi:MAG TPA: amylo-alpha-1,6-glucosidase [Bacillota bacterium]|nr:amylo-alpha-1,6-glucosidase [Bacillota bacterium]